jgi:type VI secretion system protein ImpH
MNNTDTLNNLFSMLDNDFRAEVIAAEMVEAGLDAERILILMLGPLKRPFSKDVQSVSEELSEYDHKEYSLVKTPKEGIYDMLPEGLFHHPAMHNSGKTEKEIIKMMKQRTVEEQQARKFFLPFEATINFLRMQMALYENRLDKRSTYDELVKVFAGQWDIFQLLDTRQSNIFLHLIPILHDIRDDHPAIETVMEMLLDTPVRLELQEQPLVHPAAPVMSRLGEDLLGVNFTTGNAVYYEGVDEIILRIGPLNNEMHHAFMPGGVKEKVLALLIDYLLPVHLDIKVQFELSAEEKRMQLDDDSNPYNITLGADTYL